MRNEDKNTIGRFLLSAYKSSRKIDEMQLDVLTKFLDAYSTKDDIYSWLKYYFPEKFNKDFNELHTFMYENRDIPMLNILAPRGFSKTTFASFALPIYLALNTKEFSFFLNVQSTTTRAQSVNQAIRWELEGNERLIEDYGFMIDPRRNNQDLFMLKNGCIFSCAGMDQKIRGMQVNNRRPDWVFLDDPYSDDDIGNLEALKGKNDWIRSTLIPIVDQGHSAIKICGTAIDKNDIMHELQEDQKVVSKTFKAISDEGKVNSWYGNLDDKKRLLGTLIFEREYQQSLLNSSDAIIKPDWIKFGPMPNMSMITDKVLCVDPAATVKDTSDFTGKCVIYRDANYNYFIMDVFNDKMTFNDNLEHIKRLHEKYAIKRVKIESISAFQFFGDELVRTTRISVNKVTSVKDKINRLISVSNLFENGKITFNENLSKEKRDWIYCQLCQRKRTHDDVADAIVLGLEKEQNVRIGIA